MKDEGEDDLEALRKETSAIKADTQAMLEVTKTLGTGRQLTQNEIIAFGRRAMQSRNRPWRDAFMRVIMALPSPARRRAVVWIVGRLARRSGLTGADLRAIWDEAVRLRAAQSQKNEG